MTTILRPDGFQAQVNTYLSLAARGFCKQAGPAGRPRRRALGHMPPLQIGTEGDRLDFRAGVFRRQGKGIGAWRAVRFNDMAQDGLAVEQVQHELARL